MFCLSKFENITYWQIIINLIFYVLFLSPVSFKSQVISILLTIVCPVYLPIVYHTIVYGAFGLRQLITTYSTFFHITCLFYLCYVLDSTVCLIIVYNSHFICYLLCLMFVFILLYVILLQCPESFNWYSLVLHSCWGLGQQCLHRQGYTF